MGRRARALSALLLAAVAALTVVAEVSAATPTWLPPVTLASSATSTPRLGGDVAMAPGGDAIAVWVRIDGTVTVVQASVRAPGGTWSAAQTLSTAGRSSSSPQVAIDDRGDGIVVWIEDSPDGAVVRHRTRPAGGAFSGSSPLSDAEVGRDPSEPRAAMGPDGSAAVVWIREGDSASVVQAVTRDSAGERFSLPVQISPMASAAAALDARVAVTGGGDAIAAWRQAKDVSETRVSVRPRNGAWQPSNALQTSSAGGAPDIAVNRAGPAVVAWSSSGPPSGVWTATGSATGTWSVPRLVPSSNDDSDDPQAGLDDDGTTFLAWATNRSAIAGYDGTRSMTMSDGLLYTGEPYDIVRGPTGEAVAFWSSPDDVQLRFRPPGGAFGPMVRIAATVRGLTGMALDDEGNAVAVWQQFDATGVHVTAMTLDAAPPRITAVDVPATVKAGAALDVAADAQDRWSGATLSWHFSDGTDVDGPRASHVFAEAGTAQVVVTARDAVGNVATETRTVAVVGDPPLARVDPDQDGDGVAASRDCDDANRAISPTAREVLGNAVDENCDGLAEPLGRVLAVAQLTSVPAGRTTRLLRLTVADLVAGDKVRLKCSGRGCTSKLKRTVKVGRTPKAPLNLTRYVRGARLRAGARLEITITHPQRVSRIFTFVMRTSGTGAPKRTRRCQAPGQARPVAC